MSYNPSEIGYIVHDVTFDNIQHSITIGFDVDENEVNVITKDEIIFLKRDKKIRIARNVLKTIAAQINN